MTAQTVRIAHIGIVENLSHLVRRVAFYTNRYDALPLPQFTGDDFAVDLLNKSVTFRAGRDDVVLMNFGFRIGVRQHAVPGMATGAYRCHHQPLLEQSFAVNAVLVALENLLLGNVVRPLDLGPLGVALGAHLRNFERRDGRARVFEG